MKTLTLLLSLLATTAAHAGTGVPNTAKLTAQVRGSSANIAPADFVRSSAISSGLSQIQQKLTETNSDVNCSAVYIVWGNLVGGPDAQTPTVASYSVTVEAYCQPRGFQEKAIMSAEQACEQEPKEVCMSEAYLKAFATLKPTQYIHINRPQS